MYTSVGCPQFRTFLGLGYIGFSHLCLQLREKRESTRMARLCNTEWRTKRPLSPRRQRKGKGRVSVEPRGNTVREMRTLKQWLQKFRGKYLPGVLVVKGNH